MNITLTNMLFLIAALLLAYFAMTMFVKHESDHTFTTYVYEVADCRKDMNTVCQRMAVRPIRITED